MTFYIHELYMEIPPEHPPIVSDEDWKKTVSSIIDSMRSNNGFKPITELTSDTVVMNKINTVLGKVPIKYKNNAILIMSSPLLNIQALLKDEECLYKLDKTLTQYTTEEIPINGSLLGLGDGNPVSDKTRHRKKRLRTTRKHMKGGAFYDAFWIVVIFILFFMFI